MYVAKFRLVIRPLSTKYHVLEPLDQIGLRMLLYITNTNKWETQAENHIFIAKLERGEV